MAIMLSTDERRKFSCWLDQEVADSEALIKKMEELGPGFDLLVPRMKNELVAKAIVSAMLKSIEEVTLG